MAGVCMCGNVKERNGVVPRGYTTTTFVLANHYYKNIVTHFLVGFVLIITTQRSAGQNKNANGNRFYPKNGLAMWD